MGASAKLRLRKNIVQRRRRYRVVLADLGWVDLIWDVPLSYLGSTAAAVQPNGLWNIQIKVNPTQVHEEIGHPVDAEIVRYPRNRAFPDLAFGR